MAVKRRSKAIHKTDDYGKFALDDDNREVDLTRRKRLIDSMKKHGFIASFPVVCTQGENNKLNVKDGQHRLAVAKMLKIPVYYSIEDVDFNIAEINNTPKNWSPGDYAQLWNKKGVKDYAELLEFQERYGLTITMSINILVGQSTGNGGNLQAFRQGEFRIRNREFAERVAYTYSSLAKMSKQVRNNQFQTAVSALCLVDKFDPDRLIRNAGKCTERLRSCSTRDAYMQDLEDIYNYGVPSRRLVALKIEAVRELAKRTRSGRFKST